MKLNNLPIILSLICAVSATANATASDKHKAHHHKAHHEEKKMHEEPVMKKESQDYNFATLKAGLVNPTPLGGNSGLNQGNDTYTAGLSVGRKFEDRFAVELEYMYRGENTSRSYTTSENPGNANTYWKVSSNTFMANAMVDLLDCEKFRPYLKAGAGMSANKGKDYVYSDIDEQTGVSAAYTYKGTTHNAFAWQAGAGVNMKTTEMFDTQLQYMYVDRGIVKTKANYTSNDGVSHPSSERTGRLKEHVITVGLVTKF